MACHFWLSPVLQPHSCTLVPFAELLAFASTHLPPTPLICFAVDAPGNAPIPAGEAEWLQWAEAYAARLDPLHHALVTPPDPPARRGGVLGELVKVDVYAYPWPFDPDGRWVLPQEQPTDSNPNS
ncbi:hypothetical protein [Streptomyces sp. NPDC045714]|uniref:hypothetical protein n=1 Tax=Streptomyces sp. NPDC045714 TaxID=3154913 RepID=UPI0033D399D8